MPEKLSKSCDPLQFRKFKKEFRVWLQNIYPNGYSEEVFHQNLLNRLDSGWENQLSMLGSKVKEDILWKEMDTVMLNSHPLHNRRMKFFNSKLKNGESLSLYMQRLIEDAGISEVQELTTSSIILHLFCHSVPMNETNKNIKNKVI